MIHSLNIEISLIIFQSESQTSPLFKAFQPRPALKDTGITTRLVPSNAQFKTASLVEPAVQDEQRPALKDVGITNRFIHPAGTVLLKTAPVVTDDKTFLVGEDHPGVLFNNIDSSSPVLKSSNSEVGYPGHFFLTLDEVNAAGGISAAAAKLGVAPIAAVHDAMVPRYHF